MNSKNMKKRKVTIITVCLNSEKTIRMTLNSVQNQKYREIEHLIVDGHSKDKTVSIVKEYPHVKKVISEPDKGIYDAMNKGLKIATGDIICFLNSDDFYASSNVIGTVNEIFNKDPTLEACYSDLVYVHHKNLDKITRYWKSGIFRFGAFAKGWCPPHPTFFVKRSVYNQNDIFDLNYKIASDAEIMMRFLEVKKIKVKYVPKIWVKFRTGGISNSSLKNILIQNREILKALKKNGLHSNYIYFFRNKVILTLKQLIQRP